MAKTKKPPSDPNQAAKRLIDILDDKSDKSQTKPASKKKKINKNK